MKAGKHRPAPVEDRLDVRAIQDVARLRKEAGMRLDELKDKPRCECGEGLVQQAPNGGRMNCAAPGCERGLRRPGVAFITFTTGTGAKVTVSRRGGRLESGAPLYWWESEEQNNPKAKE